MKISPSNPRLIERNIEKLEKLRVLHRQIKVLLCCLTSDVIYLKSEGKCTERYLASQEAQLNATKTILKELALFVDSEKTQKSINDTLLKAETFWKPYSKLL